MITRWYISPVLWDAENGCWECAGRRACRTMRAKAEGCATYRKPGADWMVGKAMADLEVHFAIAKTAGVRTFDGASLKEAAAVVNKQTTDFLKLRGIETQRTIGDLLDAAIKYHEPAASVALTWV